MGARRSDDAAAPEAAAAWERFARADALFYVDPARSEGVGVEEFVAGGHEVVEWALDWAGPLPRSERALDVGCGVGRDTVHLARRFARVDGIDVSPTMVRLAREFGLPANVELRVGSAADLGAFADGAFDLVFSHLVFQHVPEDAMVAAALREIARVLARDGAAVLQFDTRPRALAAELVQRLPDALLPRVRRRHIRRYRRPGPAVHGLASAAGLRVDAETGAGTADHWLRLGRA